MILSAKTNAKESKNLQQSQDIISNSENPIYLANKSDKQISYAVDSVILPQAAAAKGEDLTLSEQAQVLTNFKSPVSSYADRLSSAIRDGDPSQAYDAALAVAYLQDNNPALIRGMNKDDLAVANVYQSLAKNPKYQGEEGMERARETVYNQDENVKAERQRIVDTYFKDNSLNNADDVRRKTVKALGLSGVFTSKRSVPAGASEVYRDFLRNEIMRTGNAKIAEKSASTFMKEVYQETDTNNRKEVMMEAPERFYPNLGYILDNDKVKSLKNIVDLNKSMKSEGKFVLNDLEWENSPDTSDLLSKRLVDGDIKIKVDGKERKVVIMSDNVTQFSPLNTPTWAFAYLDDNGIEQPLMSSKDPGTSYRWIPDNEYLSSVPSKAPEYYLKMAEEQRQKYIQDMMKTVNPRNPLAGDYYE